MLNWQEIQDLEMLDSLGLYSFIRRNTEKPHAYSTCAHEHVRKKALMSRDIDDGDPPVGWQVKIGETNVDGHATGLLLGQSVGIDAGKCADQASLAMIHMSGGADEFYHQRLICEACVDT